MMEGASLYMKIVIHIKYSMLYGILHVIFDEITSDEVKAREKLH